MKLFKDEEEINKIKKERDGLIHILTTYNMSDSERRFLTRRISIISDKLINKALYGKDKPTLE